MQIVCVFKAKRFYIVSDSFNGQLIRSTIKNGGFCEERSLSDGGFFRSFAQCRFCSWCLHCSCGFCRRHPRRTASVIKQQERLRSLPETGLSD
jgi:hypothetical protein